MKSKFLNIMPGEDGTATLYLYGNVGEGAPVDAGRVAAELEAMQSAYRKIDVRINSKGGEVFAGMAIFNALKNSKADVTIYVDGLAASIAAIIALCGKPLYMSQYARLMLHQVSGCAYGSAKEIRSTADMIESLQASLAKMIAKRCGMSAKDIEAKYFNGEDHWMTAQEALRMKLVDGIYESGIEGKEPATTEEIYNYYINQLSSDGTKQIQMALLDSIQKIAGFENKDEAAIISEITNLSNQSTKVDALQKANDALKAKVAELENKEVDTFLAQAVKDGKITEEQVAHYKTLMMADRATVEALLNDMPAKASQQKPTPRAVDFINKGGADAEFENKSWDELDRAGKLAELKAKNRALFEAKFKEEFGVEYKE